VQWRRYTSSLFTARLGAQCATHTHTRHTGDNNGRVAGEAEDECTVGTRTVNALHGRLRAHEGRFADEFVRS